MKKIALVLALILSFGMMAPMLACAAEEKEIIKIQYEEMKEIPERTIGLDCYEVLENTGMELLKDGDKGLYSWSWTSHVGRDNTFLGCSFLDRSTDSHSGEYALHPKLGAGEYVYVGIRGTLIPGNTYELTVWHKRLQDGGNASAQLVFSGMKDGKSVTYDRAKRSYPGTVRDGWVQSGLRFVAPAYSQTVDISLRLNGPAEILWDDISLLCISSEMPKPDMPDKKPAFSTIELPDPGFESGRVGESIETIQGWSAIGDAKISDAYAHSGEKSLALKTEDGSADGIGILYLTGFEEGATYQISSWLLNPGELQVDIGYWLHYCSEEKYNGGVDYSLGQEKPRFNIRTTFQWQEYIAEFTPPEGTKSIMLYFRHRLTPGTVYVDDIEINMVTPPAAVIAETDAVFYYTEWESGKLTVTPKYVMHPAASKAECAVYAPGGQVLRSFTKTDLSSAFDFEFPVSIMQNSGEEYKVGIKVFGEDGALIQEEYYPIYRYDRPKYLGVDGIFRKNGKEVPFIMGSGLNMNVIDLHPEKGGITVAQLNADNPNLGYELEERMDAYYKQGMFVMLNLYSGQKTGGHPDMIEATKEKVKLIKDHPALFGYKMIDEPYQKGISDEEMIAGYKAVRDIDPNHPVYIDDSPVGGYEWAFRYCDIFECDYYGGSSQDAGRIMTDVMDKVMEASKGRKPFSVLLQFMPMYGYVPSVDENRHQIYQSLFSGATGFSYFTLNASSESNGVKGIETERWQGIVEKWAPWEQAFAVGAFITGEYKFVNYGKTEDVLFGTFTDGSDIYAVVLNRNKTEGTTAAVPLSDGTGTLKVGAYTAKTMTGEGKTTQGDGVLSVDLAPMEAVVWKVTPSGAPFESGHLKHSDFRDIIYYPWAYNAIATLEEKGIVNRVSDTWFGPGEKITRGDYAMFLVRTLGLTAGADGENFADVMADAEYAKELAIGKAAGILNGVGDNRFAPEAEITRQDMMTMTSRAMQLSGTADLSAFSDAGVIAEYAQSHVSAMVAEGFIKGNADGTINPLGNTTRAEAAVICQRILNR